MSEFLKLTILLISGIIAGFINVNAGGGSSLTLPILLFLGLDSATANGTNRIGILIQTISSTLSFKKNNHSNLKKSLILALCTLPGAISGALISVRLSDASFKKILSIILIGIIFTLFIKHKPQTEDLTDNSKAWLVYPSLFFIGFYGGFIQVGVGFLLMSALYYTLNISLVKVNMHKVFIILIYTIPTIIIFTVTGNINIIFGIILAAGMSVGGWWGAHFAVKSGEKFIKAVLAVAIIIIIVKLLNLI